MPGAYLTVAFVRAAVAFPTQGIKRDNSVRRRRLGLALMAASSSFSRALTRRLRSIRWKRSWRNAALAPQVLIEERRRVVPIGEAPPQEHILQLRQGRVERRGGLSAL